MLAAGLRPGDAVLNTCNYHLTPGVSIFDPSARPLGCALIPTGLGNIGAPRCALPCCGFWPAV